MDEHFIRDNSRNMMSGRILFLIVMILILTSVHKGDSAKDGWECMIEKYDIAWKYDKVGAFDEAMKSSIESYGYAEKCGDDEWKEKIARQFKEILGSKLSSNASVIDSLDDFKDIVTSISDINQTRISKATLTNVVFGGIFVWGSITMWLLNGYKYQDNGNKKIVDDDGVALHLKSKKGKAIDLSLYYKEIDGLCQEIFQHNCMNSMRTTYSTVKKFMDNYTSDLEKLSDLETLINENYDNILKKIKVDFPTLKREDYLLFVYSCLGFSNVSIALFLNEDKVTAIYNRRKRLKKRVRESDSLYNEYYMEILTSGKFLKS